MAADVRILLRVEQVALSLAGIGLLAILGAPWWVYLPGLLAPDLAALGYLAGPRIGALTYNAAHNLVLAVALLGIGWWSGLEWPCLAGALVLAHVGADRALGYGLKLPSGFRDTHLGRIGRG